MEQATAPTVAVYGSKCWACCLDRHYEPARAHPWADDVDLMAADDPITTAQEICACPCAQN